MLFAALTIDDTVNTTLRHYDVVRQRLRQDQVVSGALWLLNVGVSLHVEEV